MRRGREEEKNGRKKGRGGERRKEIGRKAREEP